MVKNEPAFLLRNYFSGFSAFIQLPKLRTLPSVPLRIHGESRQGNADGSLPRECFSNAVLVISEVPFPREMGCRCRGCGSHQTHSTFFPQWVYVYDATKALKTGKSQWGLHFFRNFSYQRHRVNQSKFHYGHEFGALGVVCQSPREWLLFPVWVKLIVFRTVRDKGDAVLQRICSKIPRGLIRFDRGFARRKVFEMLLGLGHHILCRAKANAVFYRLPKRPKRPKRPQRGRPKKYGDPLKIHRLRYKEVSILEKTYQVASEVVRTKMCPTEVRVVVIRTRPKRSKPYRYFCVFTTDVTLEIPKIVEYYRQRWQIETAFRDVKQHFGFDGYRVKSRKSINRFVQLSFVAASLTKLTFLKFGARRVASDRLGVQEVCDHLGIHWYHPKKLTQGLRVAYLQSQFRGLEYSMSSPEKTNSQNIQPISEHDTTLPFDKVPLEAYNIVQTLVILIVTF